MLIIRYRVPSMTALDDVSKPNEIYALIVEDDEMTAELAVDRLEYIGEYFEADYVESPDEALDVLDEEDVSAVISDYHFTGEDMDGMDLLNAVNERDPEIPFIMYTGKGSEDLAVEAIRRGADDYVRKGEDNQYELMMQRIKNATDREAVVKELEIFKKVVEEAGHSVKITDTEGEIIYVNEAFEDRTGYSQHEVAGKKPGEVAGTDNQDDEFYGEIRDTILEGDTWEGEMIKQNREGEEYWIEELAFPVEEGGEIKYLVGIGREITEKKEKENRREVLNGLLRHDISNQIQAASGYLEMLDTSEMNEAQRVALETIENSVINSSELIHGVRDILRNDPGEAAKEEIAIDEVLEGMVEDNQRRAKAQGKDIEYDSQGSAKINAGPLVDEVIGNAVENSILHADEADFIELDFEETEEEVEVIVADNGEGLPEEFSWEKGVKGVDSDGTGMGTWLMKEVANAYDADLEAGESECGGAEFRFRFDRAL
jgi:PAS domain S-box-containing protein